MCVARGGRGVALGERNDARGAAGQVKREEVVVVVAAPYPGWPMGVAFHLGEDQVPRFEIAAHVAAGDASLA